jgi:hypothetical protein
VQHLEESFELLLVFFAERLRGLRKEGDLLVFQFEAGEGFEQGRFGFLELGRGGEDCDVAVLAFDLFDGHVGGE